MRGLAVSMMFAVLSGVAPMSKFRDAAAADRSRTFGEDAEFLAAHLETVVLGERPDGPRVVIVPAYQARVMTSSASGDRGASYGWINYKHIASGIKAPQINVYGGEERLWLGPEGGQYGLFFDPGKKFEFADWRTPPLLDTESFDLVEADGSTALFRKEASLMNYSGAKFSIRIERRVELLSDEEASRSLETPLDGIQLVGYRSVNRLANAGKAPWDKKSGLLSLWMLGMYKPSPGTTIVVPFKTGTVEQLGPIVNDAYFGKPGAERLSIGDGTLFFSGDGRSRAKIGLSPQRDLGVCGSYDPDGKALTIVKYRQPPENVVDYVNSMWEEQEQPYAGDAINAYNDGSPAPGVPPLGPFYELETSSPALALKPGETAEHVQETYHLEGSVDALDAVSRKVLGVSLEQIQSALP